MTALRKIRDADRYRKARLDKQGRLREEAQNEILARPRKRRGIAKGKGPT
jgi:hypothetical protein